jgi:hypothetical protein
MSLSCFYFFQGLEKTAGFFPSLGKRTVQFTRPTQQPAKKLEAF